MPLILAVIFTAVVSKSKQEKNCCLLSFHLQIQPHYCLQVKLITQKAGSNNS